MNTLYIVTQRDLYSEGKDILGIFTNLADAKAFVTTQVGYPDPDIEYFHVNKSNVSKDIFDLCDNNGRFSKN